MGFSRGEYRRPAPVKVASRVFAVGQRAYVVGSSEGHARATLTDDHGKVPLASLGDGTEVAILGWRPGVAGNTRYRVRTSDNGLEGWLGVGSLRSTQVAASLPDPAPPAATAAAPLGVESEAGGHRFGQRRG